MELDEYSRRTPGISRPGEILLAARMCIRSIPVIDKEVEKGNDNFRKSVLIKIFRCLHSIYMKCFLANGFSNRLLQKCKNDFYEITSKKIETISSSANDCLSSVISLLDHTIRNSRPYDSIALSIRSISTASARDSAVPEMQASTTSADMWKVWEEDANTLRKTSMENLRRSPSFSNSRQPAWLSTSWQVFSGEIQRRPEESWNTWVFWWEGVFRGADVDTNAELAISQISDSDWNSDIKFLNQHIYEIRKNSVLKKAGLEGDIVEVLRDTEIIPHGASEISKNNQNEIVLDALFSDIAWVSISDFDVIDRIMQMVPFPEELIKLERPNVRRRLNELSIMAHNLYEDLQSINAPDHLVRSYKRYSEAAKKPKNRILVGYLWSLCRTSQAIREDQMTREYFPSYIDDQIGYFNKKNLDFFESEMAFTLTRLRKMKRIKTIDGASIEVVEQGLMSCETALSPGNWIHAPGPADELAAVLQMLRKSMMESQQAVNQYSDPKKQKQKSAEVWDFAKSAAGTLFRYSVKFSKIPLSSLHIAASFDELFPDDFRKACELIFSQFENVKLPWQNDEN